MGDFDNEEEDHLCSDEETHRDSDKEGPCSLDEEDPTPVNPEDSESESDESDNEPHITLASMKINLKLIRMVEKATLKSQFTPDKLQNFQNPQELQFSPSDDSDLCLSIKLFILSLDHNQSQCQGHSAPCTS